MQLPTIQGTTTSVNTHIQPLQSPLPNTPPVYTKHNLRGQSSATSMSARSSTVVAAQWLCSNKIKTLNFFLLLAFSRQEYNSTLGRSATMLTMMRQTFFVASRRSSSRHKWDHWARSPPSDWGDLPRRWLIKEVDGLTKKTTYLQRHQTYKEFAYIDRLTKSKGGDFREGVGAMTSGGSNFRAWVRARATMEAWAMGTKREMTSNFRVEATTLGRQWRRRATMEAEAMGARAEGRARVMAMERIRAKGRRARVKNE